MKIEKNIREKCGMNYAPICPLHCQYKSFSHNTTGLKEFVTCKLFNELLFERLVWEDTSLEIKRCESCMKFENSLDKPENQLVYGQKVVGFDSLLYNNVIPVLQFQDGHTEFRYFDSFIAYEIYRDMFNLDDSCLNVNCRRLVSRKNIRNR